MKQSYKIGIQFINIHLVTFINELSDGSIAGENIGCHFCHQFILREVGSLALASSTHDMNSRLTSEIEANDYFITVVIMHIQQQHCMPFEIIEGK